LKHLPVILAVIVALIALAYYVFSGRSSLDLNTRNLQKSAQIEKTQTSSDNSMLIKCKNGESYEIVFKPGQTNFDDLVYNKCGPQGRLEEQQ